MNCAELRCLESGVVALEALVDGIEALSKAVAAGGDDTIDELTANLFGLIDNARDQGERACSAARSKDSQEWDQYHDLEEVPLKSLLRNFCLIAQQRRAVAAGDLDQKDARIACLELLACEYEAGYMFPPEIV